MNTLEKINGIVEWWLNLPADYNGLNDLMHKRQILSAHLYGLATDLSKARNSWSEAQAMLEEKKNKKRVEFSKLPSSSNQKADYQARANTAELFELEKRYEGLYFGMKHQYEAVIQVLEAMAQRIAILRREWETKNLNIGA
ncbi:hypothetical protein F132_57 [Flavobacterium sp. phage 1/32]|nr:hypothetical protein F132_57 [Flavobacterium sp. phage 1/32]